MQLTAMVGTTRCQHPAQFLQTGMNIPIAMSHNDTQSMGIPNLLDTDKI